MTQKSVKSIIEEGIQSGKSTKMILARVLKLRPDATKTDEASVRYYANAAVRSGTLDAEVAQQKYGCGGRGRKAATSTKAPKVKTEKAPKVKTEKAPKVKTEKAPKAKAEKVGTAPKKSVAKKAVTKKSAASKKSEDAKS